MSVQGTYNFDIDINKPLATHDLGLLITGDNIEYKYTINLFDGDEKVSCTGASVSCYMILANKQTATFAGTATASGITLRIPLDAHSVPGAFVVAARVIQDDVKRVVFRATGSIEKETSGTNIDSGEIIDGIDELIARIDAAEAELNRVLGTIPSDYASLSADAKYMMEKVNVLVENADSFTWSMGNISDTGTSQSSQIAIRTTFFRALKGTTITPAAGYNVRVCQYEQAASPSYKLTLGASEQTVTIDEDCYVKVALLNNGKTTMSVDKSTNVSIMLFGMDLPMLYQKVLDIETNAAKTDSQTDYLSAKVSEKLASPFTWVQGTVTMDGVSSSSNNWIRTDGFTRVLRNSKITLSDKTNYKYRLLQYASASADTLIAAYEGTEENIIPNDCYIRITLGRNPQATTSVGEESVLAFDMNLIDGFTIAKQAGAKWYSENAQGRRPNISTMQNTITLPGDVYVSAYGYTFGPHTDVSISIAGVMGHEAACAVVYNYETGSFRVVTSSNAVSSTLRFGSLTQKEVVIAEFCVEKRRISTSSSGSAETIYRLASVKGFGLYTINEEDPKVYFKNREIMIPPVIPGNWYVRTAEPTIENKMEGYPEIALIYGRYDALMERHSEEITKEFHGLDQSNTYPIYTYHFKPVKIPVDFVTMDEVPQSSAQKSFLMRNRDIYPKLLIDTGIHGTERPCVYALCELLEEMYDRPYNDPVLEFLRWHVELVVTPFVNPWGYVNAQRRNSRGVDINRNFDTDLWQYGPTETDSQSYRGTAPASEAETQYLQKVVNDNLDAIAMLNYHTHGDTSAWNEITRFACTGRNNSGFWVPIANYIIKNGTSTSLRHGANIPDGEYIGRYGGGPVGSTAAEYALTCGIHGAAPEVAYRWYDKDLVYIPEGRTDPIQRPANWRFDPECQKMNMEYMANTWLAIIARTFY